MRSSLLSISLLSLLLLLGCSKGSGIPTVPVKGKITFAGGKPPAPVSITFAPVETENNLPKLAGIAVVAEDGTYYVKTEQAGNGLVPGRYSVNIDCWKQVPTMQGPGVSHVPVGFHPAQELVVKTGGAAIEYLIDVPANP